MYLRSERSMMLTAGKIKWNTKTNALEALEGFEIPAVGGIYEWIDNGNTIRIGASKDLARRFFKEHLTKSMYNSPDRIARDKTSQRIRAYFEKYGEDQPTITVQYITTMRTIEDPILGKIEVSIHKDYENHFVNLAENRGESLCLMTQKKS